MARRVLERLRYKCLVNPMIAGFMVSACSLSSNRLDRERAEKAVHDGHYAQALEHYKRMVDRAGDTPSGVYAAQQAAHIEHFDLKDFKGAIRFYRYVVLNSKSSNERVFAQRQIADIEFNNLLDYKQAVVDYSRLADLPHSAADETLYQTALARAYFYLNNFYQARLEIERVIEKSKDKQALFDALLLKANIYLTTKDLDQASLLLKKLMSEFPAQAKNENIGLVLAVTYEDQRNFSKAIEVLEEIKDTYPRKAFLESKIKALKERQSLLPGARGLKK
jgi:tetratricopeptide (TPR) repeat protein